MTPRIGLAAATLTTLALAMFVGIDVSLALLLPSPAHTFWAASGFALFVYGLWVMNLYLRRLLVAEVERAIASRRVWNGRDWVRP